MKENVKLKDDRIIGLDWMRAIACLLVVLYHYTTRYFELFMGGVSPAFSVSFGNMGVSVFFLLSGYLLISRWRENDKMLSFIGRRVTRLYPSYWACVVITFFVSYFLLPSRAVSFVDGVVNMTMLQAFFGVASVDGVYWTLAKELVFYVIVAVLILFKQKKNFPYLSFIWMAILFGSYFLSSYSKIFTVVNLVFISGYAQMFLVGANIYFIFTGNKWQQSFALIVIVASCVYQYLFHGLTYTIFFLVSMILLVGCVVLNKKGLDKSSVVRKISKPVIFISTISYQIYLLHQNVGYAILEIFHKCGFTNQWLIIIPILVSVAISYCIYRFIDVPFTKLYKKFEETKKINNDL